MNKNKHLTAADRSNIELLLHQKYTLKGIASALGFHYTTIYREVTNRRTPNGYFADVAQLDYEDKREACGKRKILADYDLRDQVVYLLKQGWSPETISGRLEYEYEHSVICHETIYQYIYEDEYAQSEHLRMYLRHGKKRRTSWRGRRTHKSKIPNRVSIHKRPEVVAERSELGHWEADSVIYPYKQAINTVNELASGLVAFTKLERKTATLTAEAMIDKLSKYKVHTITVDNGSEFTNHEDVTREVGAHVYFCDPYSSWQRGANENVNGLLRRYLPKRKSIVEVTQEELDEIAAELNHRPRKRLGYKTPYEVYYDTSYTLLITSDSCS